MVRSDYLRNLKERLGRIVWPEKFPDNSGMAAVLLTLCKNPESGFEEILLIKRSGEPGYHSRQIAFPGGFRENTDPDIRGTALREADEEIGLKPADVEVLGKLQLELTARDVLIFPWVGRISLPYNFVLNTREVERLLFLPVDRLIDEGLNAEESPGATRGESLCIKVDGELVWGLTARILHQFREHLIAGLST